jgi:hypothetical protein
LRSKIGIVEKEAAPYSIAVIIIVALAFLWIMIDRRPDKIQVIIFVGSLPRLATVRVSLPMIEIRRTDFFDEFFAIGEPIAFEDQVLIL